MNKDKKIKLDGLDVHDDTKYEMESRFVFSMKEFEKIRKGYARRPSMDYRWYIVTENDCVYILRSWNPFIVFKTQFEQVGDSFISFKSFSQFNIEGKDLQTTLRKQNQWNFWIYSLITQLIFNNIPLMGLDSLVHKAKVDFNGVHGFAHWQAVYRMGKVLYPDIDDKVLFYFSVFHDFFRENDYSDKNHGKAALTAIPSLEANLRMWNKTPQQYLTQVPLLAFAFEYHDCTPEEYVQLNDPLKDNRTIQTCLDADRLDLGRVGITPDKSYLFTKEAIKMVENGGK